MVASTTTDIVDLRIDAENLAIDEINDTVKGLGQLAEAARKAEKELQGLEIKQDTIQSYERIQQELSQLRTEVDTAEIAYEKLSKAVKANTQATDEELLAVKQSKRELADLKTELKASESEYRKVSKTLKEYSVDTKDLGAAQEKVQQQIKETSDVSAKLNAEYREQAATVRERIAVEKEAIITSKNAEAAENARVDALHTLALEQDKLIEKSKRVAQAEAAQAQQQQETKVKLKSYEDQLRSLNDQLDKSTLVKSEYIRQEERLRQELQLTEGQTKTIRNALNAEVQQRKAAEVELQHLMHYV